MGLPRRTSSFDDIQDDTTSGVMDTVDDELREMVAMMPGRNEQRMFSDGSKTKTPKSPLRKGGSASAPNTVTADYDTASYYYTYSDGAGTSSRHTTADSTTVRSARRHHQQQQQHDRSAQPPPPSMSDLPTVPNFSIAGSQAFGFTLAGWGRSGTGDTVARQNVSDAFLTVWERFWSEDLSSIIEILRRRVNQLLPHARRFIAHLVAFWGGITYLRRALAAFIRIMNKDSRVRELLERIAWASASTLRVFLSLCAMTLHALLRFYSLLRNKIIPELRLVLPRYYSRAVRSLHEIAARSPWSSSLGPMSVEVALHRSKLPNPDWLYNKFGVSPVDHVSHRAREAPLRTEQSRLPTSPARQATQKTSRDPVSTTNGRSSASYTYTYGTGTTKYVDENGATIQTNPTSRHAGQTVDGHDNDQASSDSYEYTYGTGTGLDESRRHDDDTATAATSYDYGTITERNGDDHSIYPGASKDMLAAKSAERHGKQPPGKENMLRASPVSRRLGYNSDDDDDVLE